MIGPVIIKLMIILFDPSGGRPKTPPNWRLSQVKIII